LTRPISEKQPSRSANNAAAFSSVKIAIACEDKLRNEILDPLQSQGYQIDMTDSLPPYKYQADAAGLFILARTAPISKMAAEIASWRRAGPNAGAPPLLCVNPKIDRLSSVELLDAGADDVVYNPFNARIFLARIGALLRRHTWTTPPESKPAHRLEAESISLDLLSRSVSLSGRPLPLSRLEFDLLAYFLQNSEIVKPKSDILKAVWGYPEGVQTRTLDKHVESLRRKLDGLGDRIQTVHGVGYRFHLPSSS
jgi:DNA-binding response OmpR family regulator